MTSAELAVWLDRHSILVTREDVYDRYGDDVCIPFMPLEPRGEGEDGRPLFRLFKQFPEPHFTLTKRQRRDLRKPRGDADTDSNARFTDGFAQMHADDAPVDRQDAATANSKLFWMQHGTYARPLKYLLRMARKGHFRPELPVPVIPEPAPYHQPIYERNSGGAGAKTQIAEKDFKPAKLPSKSMLEMWNEKLNHQKGILWQDLYGNIPGTHEAWTRRTAKSRDQEMELDEVMQQKFMLSLAKKVRAKKDAGHTREQLVEELKASQDQGTIRLLIFHGLSNEDAAKRSGIKEESVTKMKQRAKESINEPVISEAIANTKPQEAGWYIVLRMKSRPPYLVKLDLPAEPTDEQQAVAVWAAKIDEENRLLRSKMEKLGRTLSQDNGDLTHAGVRALGKIRPKLQEAFEQGMIFYFDPSKPLRETLIDVALLFRGDRVID